MTNKNNKDKQEEVEETLLDEVSMENEEVTDVASEAGEEIGADVPNEALQAANEKYLRLYAEFDNYKRRTTKERLELMQSAGKDVLASLLPVLDDFDRALTAMATAVEVDAVREGIDLVNQKFKKILTQHGLKEMNCVGLPFDAELQEAITSIPAPSDEFKGKVVDEIEKGYYLNDKVLRHAKVVIGN